MTLGSANFALPHHPFPSHHSVTHNSHHPSSLNNNLAEAAALSAFSAAGGAHSWAYPGGYGSSGGPSVSAASGMDHFSNYHLSGNPYLEERRHFGAAAGGSLGNPCSSFGDPFRDFHQSAHALAAAANAVSVGAMGASNAFYPSPTGKKNPKYFHYYGCVGMLRSILKTSFVALRKNAKEIFIAT